MARRSERRVEFGGLFGGAIAFGERLIGRVLHLFVGGRQLGDLGRFFVRVLLLSGHLTLPGVDPGFFLSGGFEFGLLGFLLEHEFGPGLLTKIGLLLIAEEKYKKRSQHGARKNEIHPLFHR